MNFFFLFFYRESCRAFSTSCLCRIGLLCIFKLVHLEEKMLLVIEQVDSFFFLNKIVLKLASIVLLSILILTVNLVGNHYPTCWCKNTEKKSPYFCSFDRLDFVHLPSGATRVRSLNNYHCLLAVL